jgi:hypothetical protein
MSDRFHAAILDERSATRDEGSTGEPNVVGDSGDPLLVDLVGLVGLVGLDSRGAGGRGFLHARSGCAASSRTVCFRRMPHVAPRETVQRTNTARGAVRERCASVGYRTQFCA